MEAPPPVPQPPNPDEEHIRMLVIGHWIAAGLSGLGLLFLAFHFTMMRMMFANPEMWKGSPQGAPPREIFTFMMFFYVFGAVLLLAFIILNVGSARCLRRRENRLFSLVVAGCNCIHIPLGTTLGVFTFIVLGRPSVLRMYEEAGRRGS